MAEIRFMPLRKELYSEQPARTAKAGKTALLF